MAENMDPATRAKYLHVLSLWKLGTYVTFNRRSQGWIKDNLECDPRLLAERMYKFVKAGGPVKRVKENGDPEIYANEFHDDLVFEHRGIALYVETVFFEDRDPDWCRIDVVNVHHPDD